MKNDTIIIGKEVIDLQIKALKKLRQSISLSFNKAVNKISKCKSKIIICGVGKSGIIAKKISSTLSSVGTPSFSISANECSHGDLGSITKKDLLLLISNSGNTEELNSLISFAKTNKIPLIGIVSNKESRLYKKADIKLLLPTVQEAGYGIVPTSSTSSQLALGDAIAIALMKKKKFGKLDFKKFHPAGNLGNILKTASEVMIKGKKIPFIEQNEIMKNAIKILNTKKLGFLVVVDRNGNNCGIFTDGDLKRLMQKKEYINNLKIKNFMTKNPYKVEENTLISEILANLTRKKITGVCVYNKKNRNKTIGVIHIHHLLKIIN